MSEQESIQSESEAITAGAPLLESEASRSAFAKFRSFGRKSLDPRADDVQRLKPQSYGRHPFDAVVGLETERTNGSGFSIGGGYIVTAAHVVAEAFQRFGNIFVHIPGSARVAARRAWVSSRRQSLGGNREIFDLAIVEIADQIPSLDIYHQDNALAWPPRKNEITLLGYSKDSDEYLISNSTLYRNRFIAQNYPRNLFYYANTMPGQSGAPVMGYTKGGHFLVSAIHVADRGVRNPPGRNHAEFLPSDHFEWRRSSGSPDRDCWTEI